MIQEVKDFIASEDIVVFKWRTCPYCVDAMRALDADKKTYKAIEVSEEQRSLLFEVTKQESVPSIWIKGKFIGGCNDGPESWMGVKPLIKSGKLNEFLAAPRVSPDF